jgi:osmoprotectant transport system ATP-binding protein
MSLELRKICKSYDRGMTFAVQDVSFSVPPGALVALVGESGCGKTTTLKTVNRLVEPTSGQVLIDGQDVADREAVELRRSIGYVFQGIGLFPHLSISHNVGITPTLLGWEEERIAHRVRELLELVGLDPAVHGPRLPTELSGGQRQRAGFARALAAGPSLMLLDEPFGALDPITRDNLRVEFRRIQQELRLTAVLVTHDMTEALLLADSIIVMRDGLVVGRGSPTEMLRNPGDPYIAELLETPTRQAERLVTFMGEKGNRP